MAHDAGIVIKAKSASANAAKQVLQIAQLQKVATTSLPNRASSKLRTSPNSAKAEAQRKRKECIDLLYFLIQH